MNDGMNERDALRADLETLLSEINRIGPPDPNPGLFAHNTEEYDRLMSRYWDTKLQLARHECLALSRAQSDSVRTVLALETIADSHRGAKRQPRKLTRDAELIGIKIDPEACDEYSIRLRRSQLERQFKRDLAAAHDL
jgi:hypothetical protein